MDNVDIHGYYPYPRNFIHHPWIFIRIHPDTSMVVPISNRPGEPCTEWYGPGSKFVFRCLSSSELEETDDGQARSEASTKGQACPQIFCTARHSSSIG